MKINILNCDENKFSDGKVMYKVTGLVKGSDFDNILQVFYVASPVFVGKEYNIKLTNTTDFKALKVVILDEVKDSSNKGIFNK